MDKTTSDEKLLKIIEGTAAVKPVQKVGLKTKDKTKKPLLFGLKFNFKNLALNLHNLNRGLFILAGLLTLSFFYTMISGAKKVGIDLIFPLAQESLAISKLITQAGSGFLNREEYLKEVNKRNIFLPFSQRAAGSPEGQSPDFLELVNNLKLAGVIWSSNPEVIIENIKENRTYLLKKGETIGQPGLKVKDITRSCAILEIDLAGEVKEYELK